ncbi:MAG: hypothetical protein ABL986_22720 [Vicinamibacterales bacterium]
MSALGAALLWAAAPIATFAAETWLEIRGTDFRLVGHSSPDRLRNVACDLERVAHALRPMRPALTPFTTPVVIAAAGERDLRELLPQFWERRGARPVGAYWAGAFGHHVAIRVDVPPRERLRRILHEYAHFVTHVAGTEPPPWLDEGLSELWTHAVIGEGRIVLGRPVKLHLGVLRSDARWIPVRELTSAPALPAPQNRKRVESFYAESWALAHYLVVGQARGLRSPGDLVAALMPTDDELRAYIRSGRLSSLEIPSPAAPPACGGGAARQLPESESITLRSMAMVDGGHAAAAMPPLLGVLGREPGNTTALEALGLAYFLGNQPEKAASTFERMISAGAASHVSYYYRAVLAADLPRRADGSGVIPVAEYLTRAIQLAPDFKPARERLRELQARP